MLIKVKTKALTLIEVVTTMLVVGIVAALALPIYSRAFEAARAKEAVGALQQVMTAERLYHTKENFYYPHPTEPPQGDTDEIFSNLTLNLSSPSWDYTISSAGVDNFTATAKRTSGIYVNENITLDQDGTLGGSWTGPGP